MIALISLLLVLTLSIVVTKVATIALTHTGLSRESARFQARSAFTGVGYTTTESENIVNHPVRRRILMLLMLLGNAGIVTAASSIILTFLQDEGQPGRGWLQFGLLCVGIAALWTAANSRWLDGRLARLVNRLLERYTDLEVRDYASILHLSGEYHITEILVRGEDWMANRTLAELRLREEGIMVLGVTSTDGEYLGAPTGATELHPGDELLIYGRQAAIERLDTRRSGVGGQLAHLDAIADQRRVEDEDAKKEQAQREVAEAKKVLQEKQAQTE